MLTSEQKKEALDKATAALFVEGYASEELVGILSRAFAPSPAPAPEEPEKCRCGQWKMDRLGQWVRQDIWGIVDPNTKHPITNESCITCGYCLTDPSRNVAPPEQSPSHAALLEVARRVQAVEA